MEHFCNHAVSRSLIEARAFYRVISEVIWYFRGNEIDLGGKAERLIVVLSVACGIDREQRGAFGASSKFPTGVPPSPATSASAFKLPCIFSSILGDSITSSLSPLSSLRCDWMCFTEANTWRERRRFKARQISFRAGARLRISETSRANTSEPSASFTADTSNGGTPVFGEGCERKSHVHMEWTAMIATTTSASGNDRTTCPAGQVLMRHDRRRRQE